MKSDEAIFVLRESALGEEIDYGFLVNALKSYKNPRLKLHHLVKIGALIRVKKGIYIFGDRYRRRPYSPEILANMIYGPSYVSLEWACQYYRLIPEGVTVVTNVTTQRSRHFKTPLGLFSYDHLPLAAYSVGTTYQQGALFATKEKALCDLLVLRRGRFTSLKQFKQTLYEDLRVEEDDVKSLNINHISNIFKCYPHSAINYLIKERENYA